MTRVLRYPFLSAVSCLSALACAIARDAGFTRINVISSVGTRGYYRKLGFVDGALYQTRDV